MDKRLIWAVKAAEIPQSRKKLRELSTREDLFDVSSIDTKSKKYLKAAADFEKAEKIGCSIVTYIDKEYPAQLRDLPKPPVVLYVRGNKEALSHKVYAGIVGSRKCDDYGLRTALRISQEIAQSGAGIISGGAEGVDAAAHRGAILAGAPTIAVLGSGIDVPYPYCNKDLFDKIVENGGAVISEFHFGCPPYGRNFPFRNRIVAALSDTLIVVSAARRSGSLITARLADEMSKTVFAVPGNIDSRNSAGTNRLIRDGAQVLLESISVTDELMRKKPDFFALKRDERVKPPAEEKREIKNTVRTELSEYEQEIVNIIKNGNSSLPLIEESITFEPSRLAALLGMMEIKGIVKRGRDKKYTLTERVS